MTHSTEPGLKIDFCSSKLRHRLRHGGGFGQHLARAIRVKPDKAPVVIDATAGTGQDAFVLAALGCKVILIERNPAVASALREALELASSDPNVGDICARLRLVEGESVQFLSQLKAEEHPDVVYFDPMYPLTGKNAASRGDLQTIQRLVGPDTDSPQLLLAALRVAKQRVVVKRPHKAPPVDGPKPSGDLRSPNTRYDIYGGALLG